MAQLAQGQRLTLPITATQGYYFSTSGAAVVRVTPSNGGAFVVTIGTDETDVGWFGFDASLELIAQSGVLTYNATPSALTAVQLGDQRDSDPVDVALSYGDLAGAVSRANKMLQVPTCGYESLWDSQPQTITSPVRKAGKVVAVFQGSAWTASTGTPVLTPDVTGYDVNGNKTGLNPRTQGKMLLVEPSSNAVNRIVLSSPSTNILTPQLNGKFGLWVYVELPPAALSTTLRIYINFSTNPGAASETNSGQFGWTDGMLRAGWNFLTFVMRNPLAYQPASGVSETHFNGFTFAVFGTGAFNNIKNNNLTFLSIDIQNGAGHKVYFDSIMTDFESVPQVVFGSDAGINLNEIALPLFNSYGWKGYVAIPYRVRTTGPVIVSNMSDFMSQQVIQPAAAGWDVINHTLNHPDMRSITNPGEIAYEMTAVTAWYAQQSATKGNEFYASPVSGSNERTRRVISGLGFKIQRNSSHQCNHVTAWGCDELSEVGSFDWGSATAPRLALITSGTKSDVIGCQTFSKIKPYIDTGIDYGCAIFPFWHGITTVGDNGSGEQLTGDDLLIYRSAFEKTCEYIRQKELEGALRMCKGFTEFYYGSN